MPHSVYVCVSQVIVGIYDGVPESFEVFHCSPCSTEEELKLFLSRTGKHPLKFLVLQVNRLPYKLQEVRVETQTAMHDTTAMAENQTYVLSLILYMMKSNTFFCPPNHLEY